MREILFRGKRVDNGQWVEGWLIYNHIAVPVDMENGDSFDSFRDTYFFHKVIQETVGQCIGISDKHGIEIFEDDIVKYFEPNSKTWHTRIVKWDWRFAGFGLFDKESEWCKESDWLKIKDIEVVGNIHDNKELLK